MSSVSDCGSQLDTSRLAVRGRGEITVSWALTSSLGITWKKEKTFSCSHAPISSHLPLHVYTQHTAVSNSSAE